ncbi:hypothetical protein FAZ95_23660 [Trinickia violacea]|uniref:Uncharacterized protein n=1 Tax=Trinickia violacea TaxID=2571746 RepID=A0A4P8IY87_9BURK|nr:hypothetical protein [Trinickia violacea]QCP52184.1 hypothetical protein FAZ95_23660 [Trinickia violacea]
MLLGIAFIALVIAINWMAFSARKRRREELEATRITWASEDTIRTFYAKKSRLTVVTCLAAFLFIVACGLIGLSAVNWTSHPLLATLAFAPFSLAALIGATVAGRNARRILRFGSGLPWAIPALQLDDDCLRYFDLFEVPWDDITDTREIEVAMNRNGPRAYLLLFVRRSAVDYVRDGKLNRLEVRWAASMRRPHVQGQWPPMPSGSFIVVDVDYLDKAYAPRLRVWVERLRMSARDRRPENADANGDGRYVAFVSTDESSVTRLQSTDTSFKGRPFQ